MDIKNNSLVKLRGGEIGLISFFNGKPSYVVCERFIKKFSQYDENLKYKSGNTRFDIVEIRNGESVENADNVFKRSFKMDDYELLAKINE